MASEDVYLRKDMYEADQRAIIAEIRRGNAEILRILEQNKNELNTKLEQYRNESKAELEQFKSEVNGRLGEVNSRLDKFEGEVNSRFGEVNSRLDKFEGEVNSRFDKLESRVTAHEEKMEYLGTALYDRISDTHTYMGWGFATLGIVVAIAVVALPSLKLFKIIKEHFRPSVTVEKVREIAREEIAKVFPQPRQ